MIISFVAVKSVGVVILYVSPRIKVIELLLLLARSIFKIQN